MTTTLKQMLPVRLLPTGRFAASILLENQRPNYLTMMIIDVCKDTHDSLRGV
jgi:hypothetical protein